MSKTIELTDDNFEDEITLRKKNWTNPKPIPSKGVLSKYARSVKSASEGAVTD